MNLIKQYEDYFRAKATAFVPIGHTTDNPQFASMSRQEIMSGVRSNLNLSKWTMILLNFEPKLQKTESRHFYLEIKGAFEIIKDNAQQIYNSTDLQNEALGYCLELSAKIMNEHADGTFALGKLDDGEIEFYVIPSTFDSCVGYGAEFKYQVGFSRKELIKPENWTV